jgi:aminoacylase
MTTNGTTSSSKVPTLTPEEAENALTSFSKIIQFQTVSATAPFDGEYVKCAAYIVEQLKSIPCLDKIHILEESPDHSPVVIARWKGTDSMDDKNNDNGADKETLPIILLNSHYDVVPAVQDDWKMPCFEGLRKDGRVYGRGAQDMKCV